MYALRGLFVAVVAATQAHTVFAQAPSCTPTPVPTPPAGSHCKDQGTVSAKNILIRRFQSCTDDSVGCYETCVNTPGCKSFSYKSSTNSCALFNKAVGRLGFKKSKTSGVVFYDLGGCFQAGPCQYSCSTAANPTGCGNQGIQWALYENDQGPNDGGFYSNFSPEHFKTKTPVYQSTYGSVGGFNYTRKAASQISIYGSTRTFNSNYFVLNHRFYFYAPATSQYTITLTNPDDLALMWVNTNAYSGWERANDEVDCAEGACSTFNVPINKHQYFPIRIVYAQTTAQAGFGVRITDASNNLVLDSTTANSPNLVQFACDGSAPMFAPFGAET